MKYSLLYGKSAFCLPGSAVTAVKKASQNDMRVLFALGSGRFGSEEDIAAFLGISLSAVERSLEFWRGAGVVVPSNEEPDIASSEMAEKVKVAAFTDRNSYTSGEIAAICEKNPSVKLLVDTCQTILGKVFTKTEISSVIYLSDHLRLDDEYILMLCTYCKNKERSSIRYIEKTAISLYDSGIITAAALDEYIKNETSKSEAEYKIRKLFGLGERTLTAKEKEYLDKWIISRAYPFELIEKAYEVMVGAIERPTFAYENGILEKWTEAGLKTLADVETFLGERKKEKKKSSVKGKETSFDIDEFFDLAVQRGAHRAEMTNDKSDN